MLDIDLGFAEECESQWLTNAHFPSKLGGKPAWLHLGDLPTVETLKCNKCNSQKSFLCQIYAPFDDAHNFHRTVYVFVCRTEACNAPNENSSITVLRSQLPLRNEYYPDVPPPEEGEAAPQIPPTNSKLCLACGCLGPLKCSRCKKANYCGAQHQRLHWKYHKLVCSPEKDVVPNTVEEQLLAELLFPEWEIVINSEDEDVPKIESKSKVDEQEQLKELEKLTVSGKAGEFQNFPESELEQYAKGSEEIDDKYFRKFRKECDKDPKQILRYKRNGQVLWIADTETTNIKGQQHNIPSCELCGRARVFEFQIMPQMLNYLKDSNIDWGTLAIYTCPSSCPLPADKGYVQEYCIKQDILPENK